MTKTLEIAPDAVAIMAAVEPVAAQRNRPSPHLTAEQKQAAYAARRRAHTAAWLARMEAPERPTGERTGSAAPAPQAKP